MSKSLVQQQFGAHAAAYATSTVHAKGASLGRLVELVEPQKAWHALDIATGAGHTAAAFAPHVAHVIASDLTPEMLDEARKLAAAKGFANMETAPADAEALPFDARQFDLVTCRIAPHHFPDIADFVGRGLARLKPGGTFALVDNIAPDEESTPGFTAAELRDAARAYNAFEKIRDPSHGRCLGMAEWSKVLADTGFDRDAQGAIPKDMEFDPWAERMGCDAATIERLRAMLTDGAPALQAFLKPRLRGWPALVHPRRGDHHRPQARLGAPRDLRSVARNWNPGPRGIACNAQPWLADFARRPMTDPAHDGRGRWNLPRMPRCPPTRHGVEEPHGPRTAERCVELEERERLAQSQRRSRRPSATRRRSGRPCGACPLLSARPNPSRPRLTRPGRLARQAAAQAL